MGVVAILVMGPETSMKKTLFLPSHGGSTCKLALISQAILEIREGSLKIKN